MNTKYKILSVSLVSLLSSVLPALAYYSDDPVAEKIYGEGCHLMQAGQYKEALIKYNEATKRDQHFVAAFINSASCYNSLKQYNLAIESANKALENNSESSYAYGQRAAGYYGLKQFDHALADYKEALHYDPEDGLFYSKCGMCLVDLGRYEESINYCTQGIQKDAKSPQSYYQRGLDYLFLNKNELAIADLNRHHSLVVMNKPHQRYDILFLCIAWRRLGKESTAAKIAADYEKQLPKNVWPYPIVQYQARQISGNQLLAAAKDDNQITEAKAYLGAELAAAGKKAEAKTQLEWVKDHGNHVFSEYQLAISTLQRL